MAQTSNCPPSGELVLQPGSAVVENKYTLDTGSEKYIANKSGFRMLAPAIGDAHLKYSNLYVKSLQFTEAEAWMIIDVQYEGFLTLGDKDPTGGASLASGQFPIQTHPNYSGSHPKKWGTVFGEGGSPNEFGRYLKDGEFSHFGKLPNGDGKHKRPKKSTAKGANMLEGVTSYLDASNGKYTYSRITTRSIAKWDKLGKRVKPKSTRIPVPSLGDDRDWILVSINESPLYLSASLTAYNTTVEFLGSGPGGANPLIYEDGGGWTLDSLA